MSYHSIVTFYHEGESYFTMKSEPKAKPPDMALTTIYNLMAILYLGNSKFDDDVIDHLLMRVEELRDLSHPV